MKADRACTGAVVDKTVCAWRPEGMRGGIESDYVWGGAALQPRLLKQMQSGCRRRYWVHLSLVSILSLQNCATFWQKGPEGYWTFWGLREEAKDGVMLKFIHTCV